MVQGKSSVTSCPFHLRLLASTLIVIGLSFPVCRETPLPNFFFAWDFQIWTQQNELTASVLALVTNVSIGYFTTMYQLLTMPCKVSFFGWGTKHKHHSQLSWVCSQCSVYQWVAISFMCCFHPPPLSAATLEDFGCGSVWHKQGLVDLMKAAFRTSNTREKSLCPPKKANKPT